MNQAMQGKVHGGDLFLQLALRITEPRSIYKVEFLFFRIFFLVICGIFSCICEHAYNENATN